MKSNITKCGLVLRQPLAQAGLSPCRGRGRAFCDPMTDKFEYQNLTDLEKIAALEAQNTKLKQELIKTSKEMLRLYAQLIEIKKKS